MCSFDDDCDAEVVYMNLCIKQQQRSISNIMDKSSSKSNSSDKNFGKITESSPGGSSSNNKKVWYEEVEDDSKPLLKDLQVSMKAETVVLQSPEIFH